VVRLTGFGENVPEDVRTLVEQKKEELLSGRLHPFAGPVRDQSGAVRIEEGVIPTVEELESTDYLVEGVIGNISQ